MALSRSTAKTYFETGDVPTQAQYGDLLDSLPFYDDATFTDLPGTAWDGSYKTKTLTSNTALTFSSSKKSGVLIVSQDGTGSRTLSINGTAATINTGANSKTVITFIYNEVTSGYVFTIETNVLGVAGADTTPPVLSTITIENAAPANIVATYNEALDTGSVPAASSFVVTYNGILQGVSSVGISGSVVTITMVTPAVSTDVVLLDYTPPGSGKVRDVAGNNAAALSSQAVTNNVAGGASYLAITTTNLTESPTGTWSGSAGASGVTTLGLAGDGYIEMEYTNATTNNKACLGLDTDSTNEAYTGWAYGCVPIGTLYYAIEGGSTPSTGVAPVIGDKIRISRTGSTITVKRNGTTIYTFGTGSSAALKGKANLIETGTSSISEVKGSGFA